MLAEVAGYRTWEDAWDSIFESGTRLRDRETFRRELALFCAAVRATTDPARLAADGTRERERYMWRTIREGLARRKLAPERALVACGGFHLFLDRTDPTPPPKPPKGTVFTTLVPYSYFRTSEITGYGAGNRAPRWYEGQWDAADAPETATDEHIVAVLARARKEGEPLSSADAIAASQHARMLAALRGRPHPVLDDVRDALITCCSKGRPTEEGAHLLRAMSLVEIGAAVGRVTPALGRAPLIHDFYAQLDALELGEVMGRDKRMKLALDRRQEADPRRSIFLHRLAHLAVPLGKLDAAPAGAPDAMLFREGWLLQWSPKVEDALVEKVLYGDTVEAAAVARLEEELAGDEVHAGRTCERLVRALDMDLPDAVLRLEHAADAAVDQDKRFVSLAQALTQLLILRRHAELRQLRTDTVEDLVRRCFGHACFEIPGIAAAPGEEQDAVLAGLLALAEALQAGSDLDRTLFVASLQKARAESAVPFLRGAFTGLLSEIRAESALFPRAAKEVLERELIVRRGIEKILQEPRLLEKIEPNVELVKTLLTHRNLIDEKTRGLVRKVIEQVVEELKRRLKIGIEPTIVGALQRDRHSPRRVFRNLDLRTTLRRNLRNWDHAREKLLIDRVWYHAAERNKRPWHVVVCVDQSGSMLESAIFSAVMASIFARLPAVRTSLVLFDTQVVDLSDQVGSPVDVLLSLQLGGGTNITQALQYCTQLVREPARTILVLITDFFEGRAEQDLVRQVRVMADAGMRMVGLGALGYDARPSYNKQMAGKCRKVGMDVLVCTPEKLAECMAQIIRG